MTLPGYRRVVRWFVVLVALASCTPDRSCELDDVITDFWVAHAQPSLFNCGPHDDCVIAHDAAQIPFAAQWEEMTIEGPDWWTYIGMPVDGQWVISMFVRKSSPTGRPRSTDRYECAAITKQPGCPSTAKTCLQCDGLVLRDRCSDPKGM